MKGLTEKIIFIILLSNKVFCTKVFVVDIQNLILGEVYGEVLLFYLPCFVRLFTCKWKSYLVSNTIPRWFWEEDDLTKLWLKSNSGSLILLIFLLKITSWACLLGSGLKFSFYRKAQSLLILKSLLKSVVVELISWTTEKREVSSANNFGFEVKSSGKSLI